MIEQASTLHLPGASLGVFLPHRRSYAIWSSPHSQGHCKGQVVVRFPILKINKAEAPEEQELKNVREEVLQHLTPPRALAPHKAALARMHVPFGGHLSVPQVMQGRARWGPWS